MDLARQLKEAHAELNRRRGQRDRLLEERARRQSRLDALREEARTLEQVIVLLKETSDHAREQARQAIEGLVAHSLRNVFGPEFGFRIELKDTVGRPQAEFYVTSSLAGERLETRPEDSRGGGVVDVVSLGLRVAMLETYRPGLDGALVLDEPAKHVSDDYIQAVAIFLKEVANHFNRQVLMVTHNQHLAATADRSFHVTLRDGVSRVVPSTGGAGATG